MRSSRPRCRDPLAYSTMTHVLRTQLNFSTKRLSATAYERNGLRCMAWHNDTVTWYRPGQLLSVDESWCDARCRNRQIGHSKRGTKALGTKFFHGGEHFSGFGVMGYDQGFLRMKVVRGAFNRERLERTVENVLVRDPPASSLRARAPTCARRPAARALSCSRVQLPVLQPYPNDNSVVLLDGFILHKSPEIIRMILGRGALVRFLEPYDPVHQPIEIGFRSMKLWLQRNRKGVGHLPMAEQMRLAASMVSDADSRHAYHSAGYF
mmetsp:Transcript_13954/g.36665  ORF Transcript_13954/g.36665 Transcript_13954/m.36665 type:complete len:265 (-) Transcript_13954:143-937(-)